MSHLELPCFQVPTTVSFEICKYLLPRWSDIFQKSMRLCLWFEQPYFTNHIECLQGFNECGLEAIYCLEQFWWCIFMVFLRALRNWGDQQPWHHIYHLSLSSLPSIRTFDQLNVKTLGGKYAHWKVIRITKVRTSLTGKNNGWWISIGHTEETWKCRNFNRKSAKEIHIWRLDCTYMNQIDRWNAPNRLLRTLYVLNFTKTPGIAISCQDLLFILLHGTIYQT